MISSPILPLLGGTSTIMLIGKIQKGRKNMIEYSWILLRPALCNSFYNYVRSKQKRKERVGPLKKDVGNEEVIVEDEEAAEVLNKYFSSVFTLEDLGNIPEPRQTCLSSGNGLTRIIFT